MNINELIEKAQKELDRIQEKNSIIANAYCHEIQDWDQDDEPVTDVCFGFEFYRGKGAADERRMYDLHDELQAVAARYGYDPENETHSYCRGDGTYGQIYEVSVPIGDLKTPK